MAAKTGRDDIFDIGVFQSGLIQRKIEKLSRDCGEFEPGGGQRLADDAKVIGENQSLGVG